MPELPDVAAYRKYFERHALDRRLASARVRDARIVRGLSARELEERLTGETFTATRQHGKYLFLQTDGGKWLIEHFGMTGYLWYSEDPGEAPKYDRFQLLFENGGGLSYVNARMLGWIGLTEDPDDLIQGRGLGPSALDIEYGAFKNIFSGKKGEIKPALMNQKLVAGVGNIYSDEILFHARIHPRMKLDALSEKQLKAVFKSMREVLRTAVERDGDTESLPKDYILGDRRKGAHCPVCGNSLQSVKAAGRSAYFCPHCQPEEGKK
ncbi:MAG: Fpg/Nei family DNA glycosylase [Syntrophobacteraceae bacterium]